MNDLEAKLSRLPRRAAPAEWRLEILRAAQSARAAESAVWWRGWLRPSRLALAATWLCILTLRFAAPSETSASTRPSLAGWRQQVEARQAIVSQLLVPPSAPEPAPSRLRGAVLFHRSNRFL